MGNMEGARAILTQQRETLLTTPAAQAGDGLSSLLETELREIMIRMSTKESYAHTGRAFALSGMSSHLQQRATARGDTDTSCLSAGFGASRAFGGSSGFGATAGFGASTAFGCPSAFGFSSGGSAAYGAAGSLYSAGPTFGASATAGGGGLRGAPVMFGAPVGAYETPAMLRMVEKSKNTGLQPKQQADTF
uniref:fibroin heavy chain-like n=1 Tax=Fragaria vesca subsp. vesca TaxID=101020 RepID=UPI0005CA7E6A|nr:PREDICTED: fibroin heavy chain-like [Fragaria vesca subsp. vesca]XP_011460446.1 PREDICTED: fibroin heavy chain-like [Fragaria vesca subsp. vesca]